MTEEDESEEVSENHDIIMVALEIASKSTDSDNAISNLMRHIGVAVNLDCIQIMKYDMINDKVEIICTKNTCLCIKISGYMP